jgi:hypothetical protein
MIRGYVCLGGGPEVVFPHFTQYEGDGVGPKRGRWRMDTDLKTSVLSIPSRDKQVQLFYSTDPGTFAGLMSTIDSSEGQSYKAKLRTVLGELSSDFVGVVNNISTTTHRSLAILTRSEPIYFYGLFDLRQKGAYLAFASDPIDIQPLYDSDPGRYLLYRFPVLTDDAVFIPQERICALWWTWIRRSDFSALQPFNALERRLFGQPLSTE